MKGLLERAQAYDKSDPLASHQSAFCLPPSVVYLDGNSLGPVSANAKHFLNDCVEQQWQTELIGSWNTHQWITIPQRVGASLAPLLGAEPHELISCDSISVNLFKLLSHIVNSCAERDTVLVQRGNFPTDNYVAQGLAQLTSGRITLKEVDTADLSRHLDTRVAAVVMSQVNYKTGERYDIADICEHAHRYGALMLCDLAHSAGVLKLDLHQLKVDFAVGCGYKFLNGGPGAPGFIYVAKRHHNHLQPALTGWMGHRRPFDFEADYRPAHGVTGLLTGTPPILSMAALLGALEDFKGCAMENLEAKAHALGDFFLTALAELGIANQLTLITPTDHARRAAQLSFEHPEAYGLCQALIEAGVIGDFRAPRILRFGLSPLFLSFTDVLHAAEILQRILASQSYRDPKYTERKAVT